MPDLSTHFFGLQIKSPIIAGSCGLSSNLDQIKKIAEAGAGAVVLKSIFEEEILMQLKLELNSRDFVADQEQLDYFSHIIRKENLNEYIRLISSAKKETDLPIVASVSCINSFEWVEFAAKLESAGADALELNLFQLPVRLDKKADETEKYYFDTISKVIERVNIPVSIKISHYFSNLTKTIKNLSETGIAGITLFNRFYSPDVDIENEKIIAAEPLSLPTEYLMPLRWIAIMSSRTACPLAATNGIHFSETAIKFLLAGASAVQIASVLYLEGVEVIEKMNVEIKAWMSQRRYQELDDFRGKLEMNNKNPEWFERVQFMKHFGERSF